MQLNTCEWWWLWKTPREKRQCLQNIWMLIYSVSKRVWVQLDWGHEYRFIYIYIYSYSHWPATCNFRTCEINLNVTVCETCFHGFFEALIHIHSTVACFLATFIMRKRTVGLNPYLVLLDRIALSVFYSSFLSQRNENIGIQKRFTQMH